MSMTQDRVTSTARSKILVSAATLVVAIGFTWQATSLPMGTLERPGPGLFPVVVGAFFILMCCVAIVEAQLERFKMSREVGHSSSAEQSAVIEEDTEEVVDDGPPNLRKIIAFLAILTAYVVLFVPLGFFVSTVLALIAISTLLSGISRKDIIRNVIFAIALTFLLYFIFAMTLDIRLPPGVYAPTVQ
ncbi:tripartite tricarboxylate transporter TctB family protein [Brevibacterium linens]|uniref:tripartite tricarboxylate transporter TctB family protein n=1 Tax=Brevibacterium linens TaxID=1703 RepID=UPI00351696EC